MVDLGRRVRRLSFGRRLRKYTWRREWGWLHWPHHAPTDHEPRAWAYRFHAVRLKLVSTSPFEVWFNGRDTEGGFSLHPEANLALSWAKAGYGVGSINYRSADWRRLKLEVGLLGQFLTLELHVPVWRESVEEHLHNKELAALRFNSFHEAMEAQGCTAERSYSGNLSSFASRATGTFRNTVANVDGVVGVVEERYVRCVTCKTEHVVPPHVVEIHDRPFLRASRDAYDLKKHQREAEEALSAQ